MKRDTAPIPILIETPDGVSIPATSIVAIRANYRDIEEAPDIQAFAVEVLGGQIHRVAALTLRRTFGLRRRAPRGTAPPEDMAATRSRAVEAAAILGKTGLK